MKSMLTQKMIVMLVLLTGTSAALHGYKVIEYTDKQLFIQYENGDPRPQTPQQFHTLCLGQINAFNENAKKIYMYTYLKSYADYPNGILCSVTKGLK